MNRSQPRMRIPVSARVSLVLVAILASSAHAEKFIPRDVHWDAPIYSSSFENPADAGDWQLEGGKRLAVEDGKLVLENESRGETEPTPDGNHLVAWLKREVPADFLLEFTFQPKQRGQGLAIVFFNARGKDGQSIFDESLAERDGFFRLYHSGDIDSYHISYWAGDRDKSHLRKNRGFDLVAQGKDLIHTAANNAWQTVRIYKRGGKIRLTVDDELALAWDDDGEEYGPVHDHAGWIGLRQMSHTESARYGEVNVYPLKWGDELPDRILHRSDFESGEFEGVRLSGNRQQIVEGPKGEGKVFRAEVPREDQRSELAFDRYVPEDYKWNGAVRWYAWSTFIPAGTRPAETHTILAQWHRWQEGMRRGPFSWATGNPNVFAISKETDRYYLHFSWQPDPSVKSKAGRQTSNVPVEGDRTYHEDEGRWVRWVARARWSMHDDGQFTLWRDGQQVAHHDGANYLNMPRGPYFKCGIYTGNPWEGGVDKVVTYTDDVLIGDERCCLADFLGPEADSHRTVVAQRQAQSRPRLNRGRRLPEGAEVLRDLEYIAGGHERHKLDLYLPPHEEPLPLVVWVHGGAWRKGDKGSPRGLDRLLEAGFAVASINYRLSQHAQFPAQLEDCKAAIRWLRAHAGDYGYDPDRIGIWGGSAGGHLVALVGTTAANRQFDVGPHQDVSSAVQAVCVWFGPTDFSKMDEQAGERGPFQHDAADSPESVLIGGPVQEHPARVQAANPVTYVTPEAPPFLIMHGDQDFLVPVGQGELLDQALRKVGAEVTFEVIKGAGHGFGGQARDLEPRVVEFFREQLK